MTIDKPSQKEINSEKASLYSVFQQLMAIVQFLAQLFRSSDDKYIGHKMETFWVSSNRWQNLFRFCRKIYEE